MRNLIIIIILSIAASSCTTMKRCNRLYPPIESSIVKDSIVTKTITEYKDSLIYLQLDPDTVTLISTQHISDPESSELIYIDTIFSENKFSEAFAWVDQSRLGLSLLQKDTTLQFSLDSAVRESTQWNELYHTELNKEVKVVTKIPNFFRFCSYYFFITATALLILAFVKLKKFLPF